jgi:hypothetical protein
MIPPLIFESATAHGVREAGDSGVKHARRLQGGCNKWYFGIKPDRAWHGLLIAGKIGVLKICKDAPASKEFS